MWLIISVTSFPRLSTHFISCEGFVLWLLEGNLLYLLYPCSHPHYDSDTVLWTQTSQSSQSVAEFPDYFSHSEIGSVSNEFRIKVYLLGTSAVDYIWLCDSLEFPASIIHARACVVSAVTLDLCLVEWCLPSGATQAGEYILPGHWKENLTSAMLILAVMSSSIFGDTKHADVTFKCKDIMSSSCSSPGSQIFIWDILRCYAASKGSYHNALAVKIVAWDHGFKCVQEGHSTGDVQGKLHCLCLVNHKVWQQDTNTHINGG